MKKTTSLNRRKNCLVYSAFAILIATSTISSSYADSRPAPTPCRATVDNNDQRCYLFDGQCTAIAGLPECP